jgi:hypothetical protein
VLATAKALDPTSVISTAVVVLCLCRLEVRFYSYSEAVTLHEYFRLSIKYDLTPVERCMWHVHFRKHAKYRTEVFPLWKPQKIDNAVVLQFM